MNPYDPPTSVIGKKIESDYPPSVFGPVAVAIALSATAVAGILSILSPALSTFFMPRFGWVGLILCLNPLLILLPSLRQPTRKSMYATAFMLLALSAINAVQLTIVGTVPQISNVYTERLHSSWVWSVGSFLAMGIYLLWYAAYLPKASDLKDKPTQPTT